MSAQSPEDGRRPPASSPADRARSERNRKVFIAAGIVVVLAGVVAAGFWFTGGASSQAPVEPTLRVKAVGETLVVGNKADAPVRVTVYEDFSCPACQQLERQTRGFLRADAAAGKVLVTYAPFRAVDDPYSTRALNAWGAVLEAGTPKQALRFHDLLFDHQPGEQDVDKLGVRQLVALAKQAEVSSSVTAELGSPQTSFLAGAQQAARKAGISQTPTALVDGRRLRADSVDDLVSMLQRRLSESA